MNNQINNNNNVGGGGNGTNQLSIAERTRIWAEYKEKKIKEAQKEKKKIMKETSGCTFKPQINDSFQTSRRGAGNTSNANVSDSNKGLEKYLQRMNQAKEMKVEKQRLEDQIFKKNTNATWRPKITTPQEPKLSAYINKSDRETNQQPSIKALNKPVNIHTGGSIAYQNSNTSNHDNQSKYSNSGSEDHVALSEMSPNAIKRTKDFIQYANRCKDQFVELRSDMNYDEAVSLIHQHILTLDI